jgi:four helix bundle protein
MIKSYRDLDVWQKAIDLVVTCYQLTKKFPDNEIYGLTSQLQRAAVSVPANIAEGNQR